MITRSGGVDAISGHCISHEQDSDPEKGFLFNWKHFGTTGEELEHERRSLETQLEETSRLKNTPRSDTVRGHLGNKSLNKQRDKSTEDMRDCRIATKHLTHVTFSI